MATTAESNPRGGPKYGHVSFPLNEAFAAFKPMMDDTQAAQWELLKEDPRAFRQADSATIEMTFPNPCPQPQADFEVVDEACQVRDGTMISVRFYKPLKGKENKAGIWVFKMHGGGFVVGTHEIEEVEDRYLATAGYLVASVEYRMAPEHPFPRAVVDSFDALKWCIANTDRLGVSKDKVVTAGGSAGGSLAIVMAMKAKDEGLMGIIGTIANIPMTIDSRLFYLTEGKHELQSVEQNKHASGINKEKCLWFVEQYLPNGNERQAVVAGEKQEYHSPLPRI